MVRYDGTPRPLGSGASQNGFIRTNDGAITVTTGIASDTWFPNNDTPLDKAPYSIDMTVPRGLTAVANETLEAVHHGAGTSTFR